MSMKMICDACGRVIENQKGKHPIVKFYDGGSIEGICIHCFDGEEHGRMINSISEKKPYRGTYDLCPACAISLENWFSSRKDYGNE